jgi:phospholipase/carboxylesterase
MHGYDLLTEGKSLSEAENALILLHGRGADPEDIILLAEDFCDESFYVVAPRATGNSWYPESFLVPEERNEPWLSSAVAVVKRLIDETSAYIPVERIYVMGFSQGACLALEVTARYAMKYAGVAAFSGGLIGGRIEPAKYNGDFMGTKIFIGNSDQDPHIPLKRTEESASLLRQMGAEVNLKIYPGMPHTIIRDEIDTVIGMMF